MPTPAEQKALAFVALVVLLAGAVRVVRGGALAPPDANPAEQQALARQAYAASSSAVVARKKRGSKVRNSTKEALMRRYGGAKFDSTGVMIDGGLSPTGFPPPAPRIDLDMRAGPRVPGGALVDLDVAGAAEIERLPGVGPALARRIVASRDSLGPFGGLSALGLVKGMGPATIKRLAPLVTFSGQARR